MCGIVGYVGKSQAAPILLDGLSKLEYRGYDSAGMAVYDGKKIEFEKAKGRLRLLSEKTHDGDSMKGTIGIGHTRWATHGEPSETNAHPHLNEDETIAVVHNGIIENYAKLKDKLIKRGYSFKSETDTEVVAHLLDYYYKQGNDPLTCVTKVMHRVEGAYALGIIFADYPDQIYSVRKDSPLIVGLGKDGNLIASDVPAVLKYTREVYFIENEEIARLSENAIEFFDVDGQPIEKESKTIDWDVDAAEKGGYDHFMIKEIHEEPKTVRDTLNPRIKNDKVDIEELGMSDEEMYKFLSYFDTKNLATRISCPVIASSNLQDGTCPPHTNLAPYNNLLSTDKEIHFYPLLQHVIPSDWPSKTSTFFKAHMK